MRERSVVDENVFVLHSVVAHEQFAGILSVVEVVRQVAHRAVEVVQLVHEVFGEVFLRAVLALIAFLEAVEAVYVEAGGIYRL